MICEQCKSHILRQLSSFQGNIVNCFAYGCDNVISTGHSCTRSELVRFSLEIAKNYYEYKWISIKDRLPEDGQFILYCKGHEIISAIGRYCGLSDSMPSAPIAPHYIEWKDVTHWMPLPNVSKRKDEMQDQLIKTYNELIEMENISL